MTKDYKALTRDISAYTGELRKHAPEAMQEGFHAKALHELGATRQEIAEVMAMCVYMGGAGRRSCMRRTRCGPTTSLPGPGAPARFAYSAA